MDTILDRFGRIVIPKKIREDFNLKAGTQIQIEENEKSIILTPIHGEPNLRMKDGILVFSGIPLEDLGKALTKHREERLKTIRKTNENLSCSKIKSGADVNFEFSAFHSGLAWGRKDNFLAMIKIGGCCFLRFR